MRNKMLVGSLQAALFAAILCLLCPWSVPLGAIPITLSLMGLFLAIGCLPPARALQAVGLYLLLGGIGLPVFAGFQGGVGALLGPTGGYLLSYLPAVGAATLVAKLLPRVKIWGQLVAATLTVYVGGALWYMFTAQVPLWTAVGVGVLPFLAADAVKLVAAGLLINLLRRHLSK
ncbi:MAG: biotin transporter BioY [Clostridia bacterium]|nr:biotin transporter BioY [Clostridia bacterium]